MRVFFGVIVISTILSGAARSSGSGVVRISPVENYFLAGNLSVEKYFDKESIVKEQEDFQTSTDIYEYRTKSPMKAFLLSLAVPGAGEYYLGRKYKAGTFFAVDALLWTGYFIYRGKGRDKEDEYKAFANEHYSWETYMELWIPLDDSIKERFSHSLPWDDNNNRPILGHEYFENIGKYDQFQVGWNGPNADTDPNDEGRNHPIWIAGNDTWMPADRITYLDLRQRANDYFSNATTVAMISIANHLISAFDAAIGAKKYNRGEKRYALRMKTKKIEGLTTPFLTLTATF